jgi:ParB/RepB/Spo0J family partition protein
MGDIVGLEDSIRKNSLLEPVLVMHKHYGGNGFLRPDGTKVFSRYILVSGHRRLEAIKRIRQRTPGSFEKVPCVLFKGNETAAKLAQLAENVDRKSMNPVELADSFKGLINVGLSQADIVKHTRLSASYVSTLVSIREKCIAAVLKALAAGEITIETAKDMAKLDENQQAKQLDKYRGTKFEKGKAKAKAETAKDTGRAVRPSLKGMQKVLETVTRTLVEQQAKDDERAFWRGAFTYHQYAMGTSDEIVELAKETLSKHAAAAKKVAERGAA